MPEAGEYKRLQLWLRLPRQHKRRKRKQRNRKLLSLKLPRKPPLTLTFCLAWLLEVLRKPQIRPPRKLLPVLRLVWPLELEH